MNEDVRRQMTAPGAVGGVNIVPVIDLCLVLLVILMVLSPILDHSPIDVILPPARTAEETENSVSITVAPDGRMAIKDSLVENHDQLTRYLDRVVRQTRGTDVLVVIRSDKQVSYGALTDLITVIQKAGFYNLAIGTQLKKETP